MNTPGENSYNDLMSSDRIYFRAIESREVEYDFKITPNIIIDFEKWKIDVLENTDTPPTGLEMLEYFKKLKVSSAGPSGYAPIVEVLEIKLIDRNNDELFNER